MNNQVDESKEPENEAAIERKELTQLHDSFYWFLE